MIETRFNFLLLCLISFVECKMEPFVVGGNFAHISDFPHSAFMSVSCSDQKNKTLCWICGGSILNQVMMLTAAHCLFGCTSTSSMSVAVGHAHRDQGVESTVNSYLVHEDYDEETTRSDIALIRLTSLMNFTENVKRVVLMKNPPYFEKAQIAGWGLTHETKETTTDILKFVDQFLWPDDECKKYIQENAKGMICASSDKYDDYSARAESEIKFWPYGSVEESNFEELPSSGPRICTLL